MRWLIVSILAYFMLGLQLGIGAFASYRGVSPNLLLLLIVFIALNAPRDSALIACFLIGFVQDLITLQPLGLFAFSYGIVAVLVCWLAESVRRAHPLTHLSLTFMATMVVGMLLLMHDLIRPVSPAFSYGGTVVAAQRIGPRVVAVSAIYTTILSPFVILILQQFNHLTGFGGRRWDRV